MVSRIYPLAACILMTLILGCSSGGIQTPTAPVETETARFGNTHLLQAVYMFECDPLNDAVDVIPLRDMDFHLNALRFLEPPPYLYLTLESPPKFNGNVLDIDIGLRNPYLGLVQFTGFDVCGIVFTHGSLTGFHNPDLVMAGEGDTRLLNPDGYSRWWNPSEFPHGDTMFSYKDGLLGQPADTVDFNCNINGYKYFADGLEKDAPLATLDPAKRGMFGAGMKNIRHYTIDLSGGLIFNYAFDACWKWPQGGYPWDVPDDFPPEANRPEAYDISVTEIHNSLFFIPTGFCGGALKIQIDVWDRYNADSNIVSAESLAGLEYTENTIPISSGDGYASYEFILPGENLVQNGEAELLITVQSGATGYGGILPGEPVCAYFTHEYNISSEIPPGWVRTWGGDEYDKCNDAAVDPDGNIWVTGDFMRTVDFDPGPGEEIHSATTSSHCDAFISKFGPMGGLNWARTWGGNDNTIGYAMTFDDTGNIYITGFWQGTTDFNPGEGVDNHHISGLYGAFLLKLDPNGDYQWARTWGYGYGKGVLLDSNGDVYVTGWVVDDVDMDPGPDIDMHHSYGVGDAFISKFTADGDYIRSAVWGWPGYDFGNEIVADESDNIYVTGRYAETVDFDPGPDVIEYSSNSGSSDNYLSKFDSDGNLVWVRVWGGSGLDKTLCLDIDGAANLYICGIFSDIVDFDPGPEIDEHIAGYGQDNFLCKFDSDGNYQWARGWGGGESGDSANDMARAVIVDSIGGVYVSGQFVGTTDFDPDPVAEDLHTANGGCDAFLSKFGGDGSFKWAITWGGEETVPPGSYEHSGFGELTRGMVVDTEDNVYITGLFIGSVDFNPGPGLDIHVAHGKDDAYLARIPPVGTW